MIKRFKIAYKVFKMFSDMDAILISDLDNNFIVTGVQKSGDFVRQMSIKSQSKEQIIEELVGKVVAGVSYDGDVGHPNLKVSKTEDLN